MNEIRNQLRLAWHVFRGRPLAYRLDFYGELRPRQDTHIVECHFRPCAHREPNFRLDPEWLKRSSYRPTVRGEEA